MSVRNYLVSALVSAAVLSLLACQMTAPTAFPKEAAQVFQAVGASTLDQAVWSQILARLSAHVNNPGLRASAGVEWYTEVKIIGANGNLLLEADGQGGGTLSPEARTVILELLDETTNSEVSRALNKILDNFITTPTTKATNDGSQ